MDSSPIAGLTVQLQHQLLSGRTIDLNPLKHGHVSSNLKSSKLEMFNDLYPSFKDSIYDNKINSSNLLNKLKSESSKKMVSYIFLFFNNYIEKPDSEKMMRMMDIIKSIKNLKTFKISARNQITSNSSTLPIE